MPSISEAGAARIAYADPQIEKDLQSEDEASPYIDTDFITTRVDSARRITSVILGVKFLGKNFPWRFPGSKKLKIFLKAIFGVP
jgi:hypothetical protein